MTGYLPFTMKMEEKHYGSIIWFLLYLLIIEKKLFKSFHKLMELQELILQI